MEQENFIIIKECIFGIAGNVGWLIAAQFLAAEAKAKNNRWVFIVWRVSYYLNWIWILSKILIAIAVIAS